MTHSVYADAGEVAPITGETAKRYLFSAPKERDIAPGFSYIYVIQSGERGPVKIGHGASPLWRMCQLQIGSWEELYLRGAVAVLDGCHKSLEARAHELAAKFRIRGEWFRLEPLDAIGCVLKAAQGLEVAVGSSADARECRRAQVGAEVEESLERQRIVLRRKLGMD